MKTLILKDLTKYYKVGKDKVFYALRRTNLVFDNNGLVVIGGKSGSGKSTFLNLLTMIDKPSNGQIIFNGKRYSSFKEKDKRRFYNSEIGIVFQDYHLLKDQTALYNVELPLLINGINKKTATLRAKEALIKVGIGEELHNSVVSKLSGGECQRVSIARAIINNPKILYCDEPTGALDSNNSVNVFDILKTYSKKCLVICVTHNLLLAKKYADRLIELSDGKIVNDEIIKATPEIVIDKKNKCRNGSSWINKLFLSNYKKRIKRNLFCVLSFTISLTMMYLVMGFVSNKDRAIKESVFRQLDFGSGLISEEVKTSSSGLLSLTKTNRPKLDTLMSNTKISEKFIISPNFSAIFPQNIKILYQDTPVSDIDVLPIYSFQKDYIDKTLLLYGEIPKEDNLKSVVINEAALNILNSQINKSPLYEKFKIKNQLITSYVDENEFEVIDTFTFDRYFEVSGVVKEINYLSRPKIYYSHLALEEYLKEYIIDNLSTYNGYKTTWFDRILNTEDFSILSSYSYRLFLKDIKDRESVFEDHSFGKNLVFNSQSIVLAESLFNFLQVAEYGIILFFAITFLGSILILSIMSFANYSEDHKNSAILTSLGASNDDISSIYLLESLLDGLISLILSTIIAIPIVSLVNKFIYKKIDVFNTIAIPFESFMGIKYLFPILVILGIVFVCLFSTILPILFSKKKSLKGELQTL